MESGGPHQTQGLCRASWSHMGWEQWALWLQGDAGGGTLPTGCSMPSS